MNAQTFIESYSPRGAIIFVNSFYSLTEPFNPSEDKHIAIYFGTGLATHLLKSRGYNYSDKIHDVCDDVSYVIESTAMRGSHILKLTDLIKNANIKVYILHNVSKSIQLMAQAADNALELVGVPYGFSYSKLYCFKMVADCYRAVGINVNTYKLLYRDVYLSQSFTRDYKWYKIYDSLTGEIDINWI
ncbi:NLPc/P60 superfamily protein [Sea otter poxvirus]|uniref:Protein OPG091 n=1 Tax=Sea otter poxvirus TaxID=1416741 RepID=A0A2U9QHL8_9POXV|nr:NLPc/P60 superfamily protein [Sea otter poxvirus]AWU47101.1 NLPc/P60 superfamily protein [Sea otter poxvirus]